MTLHFGNHFHYITTSLTQTKLHKSEPMKATEVLSESTEHFFHFFKKIQFSEKNLLFCSEAALQFVGLQIFIQKSILNDSIVLRCIPYGYAPCNPSEQCYTHPLPHTQSIEDTILKLLFESTGNILDDEKLIETLDASKVHHRCASDALSYHISHPYTHLPLFPPPAPPPSSCSSCSSWPLPTSCSSSLLFLPPSLPSLSPSLSPSHPFSLSLCFSKKCFLNISL